MNPIRETLVDLLFNVLLQTGVFAIAAASFSRLIAKAKAKHQYVIYPPATRCPCLNPQPSTVP
jgi:hypothetical protein